MQINKRLERITCFTDHAPLRTVLRDLLKAYAGYGAGPGAPYRWHAADRVIWQ